MNDYFALSKHKTLRYLTGKGKAFSYPIITLKLDNKLAIGAVNSRWEMLNTAENQALHLKILLVLMEI